MKKIKEQEEAQLPRLMRQNMRECKTSLYSNYKYSIMLCVAKKCAAFDFKCLFNCLMMEMLKYAT